VPSSQSGANIGDIIWLDVSFAGMEYCNSCLCYDGMADFGDHWRCNKVNRENVQVLLGFLKKPALKRGLLLYVLFTFIFIFDKINKISLTVVIII